jgi:hypothetical protein
MKSNQFQEAEAALKRALSTNRAFEGRALAQAALAEIQSRKR